MLLATIVVLLLPDWTETGNPRPIWAFAIPFLLGLLGAAFALKDKHPWWAVASAIWGFVLIQILIVTITLVSEP